MIKINTFYQLYIINYELINIYFLLLKTERLFRGSVINNPEAGCRSKTS